MLEAARSAPAQFADHARMLFGAMKTGGMVGFERVDWFNGGLFDDDGALPIELADIENLLAAAKLDWSEIDPSILGTLFERGLDPDKRSQLGAHYTDRDKIMQIVRPVIIEPLEREWAEARAKVEALVESASAQGSGIKGRSARTKALNAATAIHMTFLERLKRFRVLDPACGSGNFLNLSLLALKDIEHRANLEAEVLGLQRQFPSVGPENVLGIELNPFAAELARVSVWIGEIQWMRRNGFNASRNPILRSLDTIENRDAVLDEATGARAMWPDADAVVGNDPQYTPSLGFETFPFPEGLTPDIPASDYAADPAAQAIATAAARLNELRENWLNPPDLVRREPEVVPGYPDRILPVDEAAAQKLSKRTLTNLYNARPAWLDHAHRTLDEAVADAYGWGDDFSSGTLTDDEILARLFRLNQQRASAAGKARGTQPTTCEEGPRARPVRR